MKEIKENLKMVFWSSLIAAILIAAFSCKKKDPDIKVFEGNWKLANAICPQYGTVLQIRFVKIIGSKANHTNKYEVISGNEVFLCYATGGGYYSYKFSFKSEREDFNGGFATDGQSLDFEIKDKNEMTITHYTTPKWKIHLKRTL